MDSLHCQRDASQMMTEGFLLAVPSADLRCNKTALQTGSGTITKLNKAKYKLFGMFFSYLKNASNFFQRHDVKIL